ncbi:N-acetylmuramoyl-L-alanine amidase [Lacibacterium aquatile]|uniref:N-acetylmuramoyl-L-alanine amidase n=1 Tax=Lacibacterium aquatile TaxID=1168082 RepID=A0ABW5DXT0_9PROT
MSLDRRQFLTAALAVAGGTMLATGDALAATDPKAKPAAPAIKKTPPKPPVIKKKIIAIDAGHGGKDPGAIGATGIYEKLITMSVALDLAKRLEATKRYDVVLTRNNDTFIALSDRVRLARAGASALMISLHADSIPTNPDASGFSVYTLSEKASDGMAAALADRENAADLVGGIDLTKHSKHVKTILLDLMSRETSNNSLMMAATMVDTLHPPFSALHHPHRQANFAVLRAPDIPAVLVEMGFLSNKNDEKQLKTKTYQQKLAERLHVGIDRHFFNA